MVILDKISLCSIITYRNDYSSRPSARREIMCRGVGGGKRFHSAFTAPVTKSEDVRGTQRKIPGNRRDGLFVLANECMMIRRRNDSRRLLPPPPARDVSGAALFPHSIRESRGYRQDQIVVRGASPH
ncbi:hypothetical protein CDAR_231811 [Caerostris darwini]|uniref:Uncharacterized protein n=1 Tax=Caerostris darwini TaxID=1538125 RepID=A0AAV4TV19_9ARAC|nr:hypothetical protein CDAR_231811 [Caerostris darwini]